jgi:hypothetical protein
MKKNLYFRQSIRRQNLLSTFFFSSVSSLASWPQLLLSVFIRKNFGERHFTLASSITVAVILALMPLWYVIKSWAYQIFSWGDFFILYSSWYVFIAAFLFYSVKRAKEIRHNPSVYDFKKYSFYTGDILPYFKNMGTKKEVVNYRIIETVFEPAPFLAGGIILWLIGQPLGLLIVICSFIYGLSYEAEYRLGDHFVMNKIDEIICNENLEKAFVFDQDPDDTQGFRFYGRKPQSEEMRKKIAALMTDDEIVDAT